MADLPAPKCPRCRRVAEYQTTIEIIQPPIGRIDIAHCAECRCLFEEVRETGTTYDSTTWLPVCRICKQPVAVTAVEAAGTAFTASYQCREHAEERWRYVRDGERWDRVR